MGNTNATPNPIYPPPFSGKIKFDRQKLLGRGGFAIVYEGAYGSEPVAVKRINIEDVSISLERETKLQPKLKHKNVTKILAVEQDKDFRYKALTNELSLIKSFSITMDI